jgi:hypothetical protein
MGRAQNLCEIPAAEQMQDTRQPCGDVSLKDYLKYFATDTCGG